MLKQSNRLYLEEMEIITEIFGNRQPNKTSNYAIKHESIISYFCDEVYKGLELDKIKCPWFADVYEKSVSLGII